MQISKQKVVTIDYTLTDDDGTVIDSSQGAEPFAYIQGSGQIIRGLESALEGRGEGEALDVKIAPEDGYGSRDESLVREVPRKLFDAAEINPGMQFFTQNEQGGKQVFTVVDVNDSTVRLDGNHPLAGVNLNFAVTVVGVREATQEELDHGHVHGPGGHHH